MTFRTRVSLGRRIHRHAEMHDAIGTIQPVRRIDIPRSGCLPVVRHSDPSTTRSRSDEGAALSRPASAAGYLGAARPQPRGPARSINRYRDLSPRLDSGTDRVSRRHRGGRYPSPRRRTRRYRRSTRQSQRHAAISTTGPLETPHHCSTETEGSSAANRPRRKRKPIDRPKSDMTGQLHVLVIQCSPARPRYRYRFMRQLVAGRDFEVMLLLQPGG